MLEWSINLYWLAGTYNVNGKEPLEKNQFKEVVGILDLKPWVDLSGPDTPDIYVLGWVPAHLCSNWVALSSGSCVLQLYADSKN